MPTSFIGKIWELILNVLDASISIRTIDLPHSKIHEGEHFNYREFHEIQTLGVLEHLVITPNTTERIHMVISVGTTASNLTVELFEGATVSANGTLENTRNRNRNFSDTPSALIYEGPTVTTTGDAILRQVVGSDEGKTSALSRDNEELVFKQNTIYLLRITERDTSETVANLDFDFYQVNNN